MAIVVSATLVKSLVKDPDRPLGGAPDKSGHSGWDNPYGDPTWTWDTDWYRRVLLTCSDDAGGVVNIVNWECYGPTIKFKTTAQLGTAGDSSYDGNGVTGMHGPMVNNSTTWTVWVYNGSVTPATIKYKDTGTPCVSELRANGNRVQVLLGKKKYVAGTPDETYTIAAFLPGTGKIPPTDQVTTVLVKAPFSVGGVAVTATSDEGTPGRVTFDLHGAPGDTIWDFGDGNRDHQGDNHTVHHYTAPGTYHVTAVGGAGITAYTTVEVVDPELGEDLAKRAVEEAGERAGEVRRKRARGTEAEQAAAEADEAAEHAVDTTWQEHDLAYEEVPDNSWNKSDIIDWLESGGVDREDMHRLTKRELLEMVDNLVIKGD